MTSQRLTKGLKEPVSVLVTFMVVCHEIKRRLLLGRKAMTNLSSILKIRYYFSNKGPYSQNYGFSSSYVRM